MKGKTINYFEGSLDLHSSEIEVLERILTRVSCRYQGSEFRETLSEYELETLDNASRIISYINEEIKEVL